MANTMKVTSGICRRCTLELVSTINCRRSAEFDEGLALALADFAYGQAATDLPKSRWRIQDYLGIGISRGTEHTDAIQKVIGIDYFCQATGSDTISIDVIAHLFDRD